MQVPQDNNVSEKHTEEHTVTWNGAMSYSTINNPIVELFFKSVRNISCNDYRCIPIKNKKSVPESLGTKTLEEYFEAAWELDPLRTLKFVFYLRDCRGGKGERKLFRALINYMRTHDLCEHIVVNMKHIPTFGSWKDISLCFFGTQLETNAVELISNQLNIDKNSQSPSLCAKYAPSEGSAIDKKHNAAIKIASKLGVSISQYRKNYLVPLRKKLNIVERDMCSKQWDSIKYEYVPSVANCRYKEAFKRHDKKRYTKYINDVRHGVKKINTGVLMPYEIVNTYLKYEKCSTDVDEVIEAQWTSFLNDRRNKMPSDVNIMPLIDVSGSMFTQDKPSAISVAVSLGLLFSLLNSSPQYKGKFITFHEFPQLLSIKGDSLMEQINSIKMSQWGYSTNFQAAFDLILNMGIMLQVPAEQMPKILLILSDMQFNIADRNKSNWEEIEYKYNAAGYQRPSIIFWNLNGNSMDFPIPDSKIPNCSLVSGFNDNIMYSILGGGFPNPQEIVNNILDNERYNIINLATKKISVTN